MDEIPVNMIIFYLVNYEYKSTSKLTTYTSVSHPTGMLRYHPKNIFSEKVTDWWVTLVYMP